ncbi:MAG: aspartyl/asparaginyl beta-hydroxylase domain-containing protein, partial [Woeseiaceae bacterium]|nr:aspartyl/asparaginyl beta-hydroxylase domain-containing protein [Woeseiaceae bacterium]
GEYYARRDRFHLVVDSTGESTLSAGDEEVGMRVGELWWFDNKSIHSASNTSERYRTHLVFDVEPGGPGQRARARAPSFPDPRQLLDTARSRAPEDARQAIAFAVELYLAIRSNPARWEEVLIEHGYLERAERQPIGVLTRLLWPTLGEGRRKRREAAVAWSLAQLDLGRLGVDEIPKALQDVGGVRELSERWRSSKDQMLYGAV